MLWNKYLRLVARVPLFALPYILLFKNDTDKKLTDIFWLHRKYYSRIIRY